MNRLNIYFAAGALMTAACAAPPSEAPPAGAAATAARGKEVFNSYCAVCHNTDSDQRKTGPGLKGLFKKAKLANGKAATQVNVLDKIDQGGNGMPAYKDMLSAQEKQNLISYLKTL